MMTKDQVSNLQRTFGLHLPLGYVAFILNYPERLKAIKTDLGWKQESPADRQLLSEYEPVKRVNELVRLPNTPWTKDDGPWPASYFVIGDDETGNYWCLDTNKTDDAVLFYDHERGTFDEQAKSVMEFAGWLVQEIRKWNERHDS
jgi:hypothetical protein